MDQIEGILNLIKDEDLEKLGKLNEVDKYNTKLVGNTNSHYTANRWTKMEEKP